MSEINSEEKKYFNQHTYGLGYLSNVRTITPPKGDPYLLVKVGALYGPEDDRSYTYFDCRVIGTAAKEIVKKCAHAINSGETVLVRFILSGIWVVPFIHQQGEKQGQPGASLRANLLSVLMVMINGDVIYTAPPKEEDADSAPSAPAAEAEAIDSPDTAQASGTPSLPETTVAGADSIPPADADEVGGSDHPGAIEAPEVLASSKQSEHLTGTQHVA
ncbi:DUF3577 domain-containing protein [Pseudomonas gingeri]|uniref:DUF3577 domain-containing protein n=1 Tax=Pseudomonas gingeri TaxID=117681 RepID=UPI0015C1835A|nr:DUF3577 domain-containing protein [Pseudomonas gingeri]NWD51367.1 DUF3577 domain-containing protein [Pseudomonas gingeri]